MRFSKIALALCISTGFLTACNTGGKNANQYTLSFYQMHGNHFDRYTVNIGTTTLTDIKSYANGLKDYTDPGYDRNWDWDSYNFETQKEDFVIDAFYTYHNYKISFTYQNEEIAYTTYNLKNTNYQIPTMSPTTPGYKYTFEKPNVVGKKEDIVVPMSIERVTYQMKFYLDDEDENPVVRDYTYDSPNITIPNGLDGYDCTWKTKDKLYSFTPNTTVNLKVILGENNLGNYSLYLNKTPKKYNVTLNVNGGAMSEPTTQEVTFGEACNFPIPTFKNGAKFLGWSDSKTGTLLENGKPYTVASNATLIARYGLDFENESEKDMIYDKANDPSTVGSSALDSSFKTSGNKSLKITSAHATMRATFDSDFLASAFADPNVVAINFDATASTNITKFSYQNTINHPYEAFDIEGLGIVANEWKTFSLTREQYTAIGNSYNLLTTVGNQLPVGEFFWIDNVRPVTEYLTPLTFDNAKLVAYKADPSYAEHRNISYRNLQNKEIFLIQTNSGGDSQHCFSYDIKSQGLRSLKYHKTGDKNAFLKLLNLGTIESVTFDFYTTERLNNSVTLLAADNTPIAKEIITANEWHTYTVTQEHLTTDSWNVTLFANLFGSTTHDCYIDNIRVEIQK